MKLKHLFLLWMISACLPSYSQTLQWATRMGGPDSDPNTYPDELVYDVVSDNEGNVYSCGRIRTLADFSGVPATTYGGYDVFISKHNCFGQLVWQRTCGGDFDEYASALALDDSGNIYMTGVLYVGATTPVTFIDTVLSVGLYNMFLAKLDTSGNLIWLNFSDNTTENINSAGFKLHVDKAGFLNLSFGVVNAGELLTGVNVNTGPYLAKFDTTGNLLSLFNYSQDYTVGSRDFTMDNNHNYILTGSWHLDTVYIGNQMLINPKPGNAEIFYAAKFDSIGTLQWIYMFDDTISGLTYGEGYGIVTDAADNIYISGSASVGLKCGNYAFANLPGYNSGLPFVIKLTPQGQPVWMSQAYEEFPGYASGGIAMKQNGNLVFSGFFRGKTIFGTDTITNAGSGLQDVFIAEVSASGQMLSGIKIPFTGTKDESYCITTDSMDNIYVGGAFNQSITLNGTTIFDAGGYTDGFIVKYGSICVTGVDENNEDNTGITVYPNPASNYITIESKTNFHAINISAITGQQLFSSSYSNQKETTVNVNDLPAGIYIVTVSTKEGVANSKLVVE